MSQRRHSAGRAGLLFLLAISLAALTGCSADRNVVARVGTRTLTVEDFLAAARGSGASYSGPADTAKAALLADMVRRELLVCAAEDRGLFRDTLVTRYRELQEDQLLLQSMNRLLTPATVPVSEGELRELYAQRDSATHLMAIYAFSRGAAEVARMEVERTGDFTAVATRLNPTGSLPPGGDVGEVRAGNLVEPIDGIARTAPVGRVTAPIEIAGQGWFLLLPVSRVARPQPPFEEQRPALTEMMVRRKQRLAAVAHHTRLREAYALELVPGAAQSIFAHVNPPMGVAPSYSAEDLARPLARWIEPRGARAYTFGDALADLSGTRDKPNGMVIPAIEEWLRLEASRRITLAEARRRSLPADPAFRRQLDQTVNGYVLDAVYTDEVLNKSLPGPDDARLAYERQRARFEKVTAVTLDVVTFPDSTAAAAFARHGGHAPTLRAAVAMMPDPPAVETLELGFPTRDPAWAMLEPTLSAMRQGDAIGPFPMGNGYRAVQVVARQAQVVPFESLDEQSRGMLEQEGQQVARERRLEQYLDELRAKHPPKTFPARLRKLPWPVPASGS